MYNDREYPPDLSSYVNASGWPIWAAYFTDNGDTMKDPKFKTIAERGAYELGRSSANRGLEDIYSDTKSEIRTMKMLINSLIMQLTAKGDANSINTAENLHRIIHPDE